MQLIPQRARFCNIQNNPKKMEKIRTTIPEGKCTKPIKCTFSVGVNRPSGAKNGFLGGKIF